MSDAEEFTPRELVDIRMQAFANAWGLTLMFDKHDRVKFFSTSHGGEWLKREDAAALSGAAPPGSVMALLQ